MHDEPNPGGALAPAEVDDLMQSAVLAWLLEVYPAQLSIAEVVQAMSDAPRAAVDRHDIERAVRDLGCAGLLHRHGDFVFASWPAVRAAKLHPD